MLSSWIMLSSQFRQSPYCSSSIVNTYLYIKCHTLQTHRLLAYNMIFFVIIPTCVPSCDAVVAYIIATPNLWWYFESAMWCAMCDVRWCARQGTHNFLLGCCLVVHRMPAESSEYIQTHTTGFALIGIQIGWYGVGVCLLCGIQWISPAVHRTDDEIRLGWFVSGIELRDGIWIWCAILFHWEHNCGWWKSSRMFACFRVVGNADWDLNSWLIICVNLGELCIFFLIKQSK